MYHPTFSQMAEDAARAPGRAGAPASDSRPGTTAGCGRFAGTMVGQAGSSGVLLENAPTMVEGFKPVYARPSGHDPFLSHTAGTPARGEMTRILVVDDDAMTCGMVAATLEDAGYDVRTAGDGEAAWAALLASTFNLVITDDIMPKASGLALVRRIRVADLALLVIVASDRLDPTEVAKLTHDPWSRFDAYLHKPFTTFQMLAAVHTVLSTE